MTDVTREEIERLIDLERSLIELHSKVAKAIVNGGLQDDTNLHLVQHRLGHVLHRVGVMENAGDLSKEKIEDYQQMWKEWSEL